MAQIERIVVGTGVILASDDEGNIHEVSGQDTNEAIKLLKSFIDFSNQVEIALVSDADMFKLLLALRLDYE